MTQNNLLTYVQVIKGECGRVEIIDRQLEEHFFDDDGNSMTSYHVNYHFSDGAVIRYEFERDHEPLGDDVCPECWISYKVIHSPRELKITPGYKSFINQCQESFWIKINQVHQEEADIANP